MLDIKKYERKPFYVDAVEVTLENIKEAAEWCGGAVVKVVGGDPFVQVKVHNPRSDRQTKAQVGDWLLYAGSGFKVYTPNAFEKGFEPLKNQDLQQAMDNIQKPMTDAGKEVINTLVEEIAEQDTDYRDAKTGQYVSEEFAKANPDTTVGEASDIATSFPDEVETADGSGLDEDPVVSSDPETDMNPE